MYIQPFRTVQLNHDVIAVDYRLPNKYDKCGILLTADHHFDNPLCIRKLLKKDHDDAVRKGASIIAVGDTFCAMQGRSDKRHSKGNVRPENQVTDYLGSLVREASKFYRNYASNYLMFSPGNHETAILKKMEYDLLTGLVSDLNLRTGGNILQGTYKGWILFRFWRKNEERPHPEYTIRMAYHHGYGGGGPVTKGVIQTNRRGNYMPDADIIVTGHIHEKWIISIPRERLDSKFNVVYDEQYHVQVPTYKEEYGKSSGWHIERGGPPKPLGGVMMEITKEYIGGQVYYKPDFRPTFDMRYFKQFTDH